VGSGLRNTLLRGIALDYKKVMVALSSAMGSGFAMAHGTGYDHTHALMESPGMWLCLIVSVGVGAAIFQSSARAKRPIPIEIDQRRDRNR
jgi:hypothetical protein